VHAQRVECKKNFFIFQLSVFGFRLSEAVHFHLCLLDDALLNHEVTDVFPVIALKLNHLAQLFVVDDRAVAVETLLERTKHFFQIDSVGNALDCGKKFTSGSLLETNIFFALLKSQRQNQARKRSAQRREALQ
jgi:hypothetical protein